MWATKSTDRPTNLLLQQLVLIKVYGSDDLYTFNLILFRRNNFSLALQLLQAAATIY